MAWIAPLVGGVVGAGATIWGDIRGRKNAEVNPNVVPTPEAVPVPNIGGTVQTTSRVWSQQEYQQSEQLYKYYQWAMEQEMARLNDFARRRGSPVLPAEIQVAQNKVYQELGLTPEQANQLKAFEQLQSDREQGLVTVNPDGSVTQNQNTPWAETFTSQLMGQGNQWNDIAMGTQRSAVGEQERLQAIGEAQGLMQYLQTPGLPQEQMDAARARLSQIQASLYNQTASSNNQAQYLQEQARQAQAMGYSSLQEYQASIASQEQGLRDVIAGNAPSVAELERQRALEQTQRANLSMAASARDPNAYRAAIQANAGASGQASYDAALLRAKEIEAARGQLAQVSAQRGAVQDYLQQVYGQQLGAAGQYATLAGNTLGQQASTAATMAGTEAQLAQAQQNAALTTQQAGLDYLTSATQAANTYQTNQQQLSDQYALQTQSTAAGAAQNAYQAAGNMAVDQARAAIDTAAINTGAASQYGSTMAGIAEGNANRDVAITQDTTNKLLGVIANTGAAAGTLGGGKAPSGGAENTVSKNTAG